MVGLPSPHGDKLSALLENDKLPEVDRPRVAQAMQRHREWVSELQAVDGQSEEKVEKMALLLNAYKYSVDVDLIFDSPADFLHRQKGQLKLDNTVIEEFATILVTKCLAEHFEGQRLSVGPSNCISAVRFESGILQSLPGGGMQIRSKDQDFAITRKLVLQASHEADFADSVIIETNLAYVVAECKTNLDKTMFQEAAATALDIKTLVPAARYYLLCEWLDMTPINTATTAIDEIIVLRKAKRLPSNIRRFFSTAAGREQNRQLFVNHLSSNPVSPASLLRFLGHIRTMVDADYLTEETVLDRGYF